MSTRRIITDFSAEHKPHVEQLRAIASDLLKHMRNNLTDPRAFKAYAESFKIVSGLLGDGDLPTELKINHDNTDTAEFEE